MRSLRPALLLLATLAACGEGDIECGAPADASGTWTYTGVQSGPSSATTGTLSGELTLSRTGTCSLQGTLSLTLTPGAGSPTSDGGPTSAIFADENSIELTAHVLGERLHSGDWVADTIAGSWNDFGNNTNGTFRLVRTVGP